MKSGLIKKVIAGMAGTFVLMLVVLCIHLYIMTRPGVTDPKVAALARIDLKQNISEADAAKIGSWLYGQQGIDHVLCNAPAGVVVFSYYPARVSADAIVSNFKAGFNYPLATRFVPSENDLKGSCPVLAGSLSYKLIEFFKHI